MHTKSILVFSILAFLSGCAQEVVVDLPVGEAPPPATRPRDGLLGNPELQAVVDLQVARDGEGLRDLLVSQNAAVRARAAFALGSVQFPEAGSALTGLLTDPEAAVRRDAAFALGQLMDPAYGPALLGAFGNEEDAGVRAGLLEAIGKAGDARVLEPLIALDLSGQESAARNLAVSRLGLRGITLPTSISFLVAALKSDIPQARMNAAYYFGRNASAEPWARSSNSVRFVLDSLPPSDPLAMQLLLGLAALGDQGDHARFLSWMKKSPDWRTRASAARGLTGRADNTLVRVGLLEALGEPSTHVGVSAATALSGLQELGPGERDALKEWIEDHPQDWRTAGPLLALLGRSGEGPFLREWLDSWAEEDVIPRTRGVGALVFVPNPEATQWLMDAAESSQSRVRGTALGGLARRWRVERKDDATVLRYFQAFANGLRTGDPSAGFVAGPALADSAFLPLGSMDVLTNQYRASSVSDDLEVMQVLLRAIGATGTPEGEAFVRQASEGDNTALRTTAIAVLAELTGEEVETPVEASGPDREVDWAALGELGARPRLILETEKGVVTLILDTESAPLTVQTIAGFAQEGLYNDTPFHRVVPNFVIQGGDFSRQDGFGGPGFSIRSEFTQIPYQRGVLGMASSGKDTEGSQFFIMHSMAPHLDGGYTSFGWVESGMDVVDVLYEDDRIVSARVEADHS
jgi:cyclophilin family peptidyl-prolyl cis-trans isomerase/HEAT repeat protein